MKDLRIWVDNMLGRITMYRLVIAGLTAMVVMAGCLMATGYLAFSLAGFAASVVVSVAIGLGSNYVFAKMFGLRSHGESAVITALIIALLFTPPTTALAMAKIALVVIIANLSKYLLVVRGKHIFNPAAIAMVIASVSGLAYASWWVASPGMLPVTALVALLILYKVEKLRMAAVFLAVSIATIVLLSATRDAVTLQGLWLAVTSWPLVFFAGIMLSEPLTSAPRHKQQLLVAALVGVLLPLDFHYASISMTPALALVLGNVLAFWWGHKRAVKLRLVATKKHGRDGHEMIFDVTPFRFVPGQFIELSVPQADADSRGTRRVFTIVGKPGDEQLSIATHIPAKPSAFKRALRGMKTGTTIYGVRVGGDFVLPHDTSVPIVCIAGGIGITPFISFLLAGGRRDVTIIYAVSNVADLMFVEQLRHFDVKVIVVSPDDARLPDKEWRHVKGRVDRQLINEYVRNDTHVYVSGPPAMVTNTKELAANAGAARVYTDQFTGY